MTPPKYFLYARKSADEQEKGRGRASADEGRQRPKF